MNSKKRINILYSSWRILFFACCMLASHLQGSMTINDFSQLNETRVNAIYYPSSIEEIHTILMHAKKTGKKISVAGKMHSQGGHAFYRDNIVIDTKNFNKILKLDTQNKIITVQPGATWEQIQECINPHNLAIKVMQTAQIFTVGGSLSVNAHGRDPRFGPLIETVKSIRIMLASGDIVNANRNENYELFRLAIGGYGLFGIIIEADIELTDNTIYKKKTHIIKTQDYPAFIEKHVLGNPEIGLHHGIICLAPYNHFKKMVAINLTALSPLEKIPQQAYDLEQERFINISKLGLRLRRKSRFINFCSEVGEWPIVVMREKLPYTSCRNNAMRHPVKCIEHTASSNTDILQSYFIPIHCFSTFMNFLKQYAHDEDLKILYILTRYIPKNKESFLYYTSENYFEIVIFINHGTKNDQIIHAQKWTQKIIDEVLSYNGKFYLPTRLCGSDIQINQAYPQLQEFFAKKRQFDPGELFINHFYKTYTHRSNPDVMKNAQRHNGWHVLQNLFARFFPYP